MIPPKIHHNLFYYTPHMWEKLEEKIAKFAQEQEEKKNKFLESITKEDIRKYSFEALHRWQSWKKVHITKTDERWNFILSYQNWLLYIILISPIINLGILGYLYNSDTYPDFRGSIEAFSTQLWIETNLLIICFCILLVILTYIHIPLTLPKPYIFDFESWYFKGKNTSIELHQPGDMSQPADYIPLSDIYALRIVKTQESELWPRSEELHGILQDGRVFFIIALIGRNQIKPFAVLLWEKLGVDVYDYV